MEKKNIVTIKNFDHYGRGIAKVDEKTIFVWDSVIQDEVEIEYIKEKRKYKEAIVKKVIKPSVLRVNNPCIYNDKCGGCTLLNISYNEALKFKENRVKEIMRKFCKNDIRVNSIIYDKQFNYRNKIVLHVEGKEVGLYEKGTNKIVAISKCLLVDEKLNIMIKRIKDFVNTYDHGIKEIMLRINKGNIMMEVKGRCSSELLINGFNEVYSLSLNDNLLLGQEYLTMDLCDCKFNVSSKAFFQVNSLVAEKMFDYITNYLKGKSYKKVLDLYCGTGVIGILVSPYVEEVTGIEVISDAIVNANINKKLNKVENISFICGKTEDYIGKFSDIDLIIVDPPRKGLDKNTISNIIRIKPQELIYVSCDAITLARDIELLSEFYDVLEINPFDMFPNTYHVECVCVLKLKRNVDL